MRRPFILALPISLSIFCLWGCHSRKQQAKAPTPETQALSPIIEPSLRDKDFREVAGLSKVYFDFDKSTLRSDAREVLKQNFDLLAKHPSWEVLIDGHTDERGTDQYNLALGQLRAAAIRAFYMALGLPGDRIATISYGKEKPFCMSHEEECWQKNRRGVTKVAESSKGQ